MTFICEMDTIGCHLPPSQMASACGDAEMLLRSNKAGAVFYCNVADLGAKMHDAGFPVNIFGRTREDEGLGKDDAASLIYGFSHDGFEVMPIVFESLFLGKAGVHHHADIVDPDEYGHNSRSISGLEVVSPLPQDS